MYVQVNISLLFSADYNTGYDAAAADTAGVADAAAAGDPWVVRRADAKVFWRFLESFFLSM